MSFTYRGTTSDSMFFNVTERQVYNAPAFDVNAIEVPGRSGDVLNSQQRFKNKTLVYTGFIRSSDFPGNTQWERLSRGLRNIKAWICGDAGKYHDLTDDYDPGFIRRAFVSGETAINILFDRPDGATITITFMAEPFMYEVSEPMELPETKSASGSIITITDGADNTPLKSAVVNIEPVQDLHGYSYPWPGGGGVNQLPPTYVRRSGYTKPAATTNGNIITFTDYDAGGRFVGFNVPTVVGEKYTVKYTARANVNGVQVVESDTEPTAWINGGQGVGIDSAYTYTATKAWAQVWIEITANNATITNLQFEKGSSATAWRPYSNICPISGWTQVNVWVKPTYDTSLTPTATIALGQTVYGGTVDVVAGKLTIDRVHLNMTSITNWTVDKDAKRCYKVVSGMAPAASVSTVADGLICNRFASVNATQIYTSNVEGVAISVGSALQFHINGVTDDPNATMASVNQYFSDNSTEIVYKLATPIEVDLTPQTIKTLLGVNNIWANTGETEVEYIVPTENPTQWPSQPRLEITMSGAGTLTVNGKTWSIGSYTGTLICDSEIMDWYDAGALKNSLVSGDGFPELVPGDNVITYTGGITKVVATPRWRTL